MSQVFHHSANTISKVTIFGLVVLFGFIGCVVVILNGSDWATNQSVPREQPVPFSHAHHVGDGGSTAGTVTPRWRTSAFAGIPPTKTCMNCHSQIWSTSPMLEPVRASFRTGESIRWTRVHDLPDYVYFNHSMHVKKGVGCDHLSRTEWIGCR